MKIFIKIILFMFLIKNNYAQQVVMFNHYFHKPMVYNPAFTGTGDSPNLTLVNHTQWTGFKNGPRLNFLAFDGRIKNKNAGLGITILNDKKGISNRVGGNILYSYKLKIKDKIYLLFGISAGVINQSLNYSNIVVEKQNDPSLFSNNQNNTSFDTNLGFAFNYNNFSLGFSVPQTANNKINYLSSTQKKTYYTQNRHYITSIKYNFLISKEKEITLSPLALIRFTPNTPIQYDANINIDFKNKFWVGAAYKNNYAVGLNLGINLYQRITIGYSYDYVIGNLNKYSGLSHEIMLNYKFIKKIKSEATIEKEEDQLLKKLASQDLNKIIIDRIYKKIDALLDNNTASAEEINALLEEISSFLDSDTSTEENDVLKKYYNSLKQLSGEVNVLVKGKIILEGYTSNEVLSKAIINVTDLGTKKIVSTCRPSIKDAKYYFILKPGRKYTITVECDGYQKYIKLFSPDGSNESYEMSQEIQLNK